MAQLRGDDISKIAGAIARLLSNLAIGLILPDAPQNQNFCGIEGAILALKQLAVNNLKERIEVIQAQGSSSAWELT